ncbi:MAG: response regulator [Verrucomicrobiae bacterium]|nr:response regulator [Verrucomicrobiae bacterium]
MIPLSPTYSGRILLIEDSLADIRLFEAALQTVENHPHVEIAYNGESALALLEESSSLPDIIILDLNLPGMDGHEVLVKLKSDDRWTSIPVIVLSTTHCPQEIRSVYRNHASSFVSKSSDFGTFTTAIQCLCRHWFQTSVLPNFLTSPPCQIDL